jgi:hypothetical protein
VAGALEDLDCHRRLLLSDARKFIKAGPEIGGGRNISPDRGSISFVPSGHYAGGIDNPGGYLVYEAMELGRLGKMPLLAAVQGERQRAGCVFPDERGFRGGSGCGGVACDDTVSVSDKGRPSPLPFAEVRGGP